MTDEPRQFLTRFINLTDMEWHALEHQLSIKTISRKDFFIQKGQNTTDIGFFLSGSCRLFYDKDCEDQYLKLLGSPAKRKIIERIPNQYIALYLDITPVSLSRIRRRIIPV